MITERKYRRYINKNREKKKAVRKMIGNPCITNCKTLITIFSFDPKRCDRSINNKRQERNKKKMKRKTSTLADSQTNYV